MVLKVKKGRHYCNLFWSFLGFTCKKSINFQLTLLEGWDYDYRDFGNGVNDFDTSKLLRLSDSLHHWQDSVGLGINKKEDGSLWFRSIVHRDSKIITKEICKAEIGKTYECKLHIGNENYYVKAGSNMKATKRTSNYNGLRYTLGAMAGGNLKAPNDLKIKIKIL